MRDMLIGHLAKRLIKCRLLLTKQLFTQSFDVESLTLGDQMSAAHREGTPVRDHRRRPHGLGNQGRFGVGWFLRLAVRESSLEVTRTDAQN